MTSAFTHSLYFQTWKPGPGHTELGRGSAAPGPQMLGRGEWPCYSDFYSRAQPVPSGQRGFETCPSFLSCAVSPETIWSTRPQESTLDLGAVKPLWRTFPSLERRVSRPVTWGRQCKHLGKRRSWLMWVVFALISFASTVWFPPSY